MKNVNFLKEVLTDTKNNVSLISLNQNTLTDSVDFLLSHLLQTNKKIILISFTQDGETILNKYNTPNLFVIDAHLEEKKETNKLIGLENPSNLTQLQISIQKAKKKLNSNVLIIFDSLSLISIYNSQETLGRFIYIFSNKVRLADDSCIYLISHGTIEKHILNTAKQFCDKFYDFSKIAIESIK